MAKKRRRKNGPVTKAHRAFLNQHRHKYDMMLKAQKGHCALCPRKPTPLRKLDLDHHHANMIVRGLLCVPCNRALRDWMTVEWAKNLVKYLPNNWNDVDV